jgi:transposase-like protein
VKIRAQWVYLYRAVHCDGNTVDFRLSCKRDVAAAKAFFRKALKTRGRALLSITLDGYAASHRAIREMPIEDAIWKDTKLRSSKHLNNMIERADVEAVVAGALVAGCGAAEQIGADLGIPAPAGAAANQP